MRLQTEIPFKKQSENLIDYHSSLLLLGSCFSENIGGKLAYFKFKNFQNPFGILFHPKAIQTLVENVVSQKTYSEADLFFYNEQWSCFDAHSRLNSFFKEGLIEELNNQINSTNKQLTSSTHIIITLGTAWVYRFLETNEIVANCHKVPQNEFKKELLSVEAIVESLNTILELINKVNNKVEIIFTVSPVRHLKDGFVENTQSKAHLITAIHKIQNQNTFLNTNPLFYFPSFEIMMDELRDYRFYAEDMIHPNQTAINYIWERFKDNWIDKNVFRIMDEVDSIQKGILHKPFNPNSKAHQNFLANIAEKEKVLNSLYPHIRF